MTQEQYVMIKKILIGGCPACAMELCHALDELVNSCKKMSEEINKKENKKEEK